MKILSSIILALTFSLITGCFSPQRCQVAGFNVWEDTLFSADTKSYQYCDVLKKAMGGDEKYIIEISSLRIFEGNGASAYGHSVTLVELILSIGEAEYAKIISRLSFRRKKYIFNKLNVGLEHTNNKSLNGKTKEEVFPILAKEILETKSD